MKVNYGELIRVVEKVKFEEMEEISYARINYLLIPCEYGEEERREGAPPVFFQASTVSNWDIYFAIEEIQEEFRKPVLLHEILEVERFKELERRGMPFHEALKSAHKIAMGYDDRYAKESFDAETYDRYCDFTRQVRG